MGGGGLDQFVEVPFEHLGQAVSRESDPVVGDAGLREIVGADLLGAIPRTHHLLPFGGDGSLFLLPLDVEEAGPEDAHGLGLALYLAAPLLALYPQPRRD